MIEQMNPFFPAFCFVLTCLLVWGAVIGIVLFFEWVFGE